MSKDIQPRTLDEAFVWDYDTAQRIINSEVGKSIGHSDLDGAANTIRCLQTRVVEGIDPLYLGKEDRTAVFFLSTATGSMALSNFYYHVAAKAAQMAMKEGATPAQAARALASPSPESIVVYEIPKRVRKRTRSPRTHIHRRR